MSKKKSARLRPVSINVALTEPQVIFIQQAVEYRMTGLAEDLTDDDMTTEEREWRLDELQQCHLLDKRLQEVEEEFVNS
jgi:hypothetical protein